LKILILGYGLVGRAAYNVLKKILPHAEFTVVSKEFVPFSDEKRWYFMMEEKHFLAEEPDERLLEFLGDKITVHTGVIGANASIAKCDAIYKDKAGVFSGGTAGPISYRKYCTDSGGFFAEGKITPVGVYSFGEWAKSFIPSCSFYEGEVQSINPEKKEVVVKSVGPKSEAVTFGYDYLISSLALDMLDIFLSTRGVQSNFEIESSIRKSLENFPVYVVKTQFGCGDFDQGRRWSLRINDILRSDRFSDGDFLRYYDLDSNSPFYQHIMYRNKDQSIVIYSLTIKHDFDFISYRVYNPGRIRRVDSSMVSQFLSKLNEHGIFCIGRYGTWEGAWTVWDDFKMSLKIGERLCLEN